MRTDLQQYEKIDHYLTGQLSAQEKIAFEQEMNQNTDLQQTVEVQKSIIKVANRKALMAEINSVSTMANGTMFGNTFWISTGIIITAAITTFVIITNQQTEKVATVTNQTNEPKIINYSQTVIANPLTKQTEITQEQPETTFSTINKYEDLEEDLMGVTVNFEPIDRRDEFYFNQETNLKDETESKENIKTKTGKNRSHKSSFPGGNPALKEFIDYNLHYPSTAKQKGLEGVVRVNFLVSENGEIMDIEAQCIQMNYKDGIPFNEMKQFLNKKVENLFINNATHLLRTMPKWKTAKDSNGNPVLSHQRIYFKYDLEQGCSAYQLDE